MYFAQIIITEYIMMLIIVLLISAGLETELKKGMGEERNSFNLSLNK